MTSSYWESEPQGRITVPVARPLLPSAAEILPYLRRIDETRWYSNGGPLVQELEQRLAAHIGADAKIAAVTNATIGLTLALLAHEPPAGSFCMVPAWTFAASAHAIQLAGLKPWIVDVDPQNWKLEPSAARRLLPHAPGTVGAIMPVSPFGAPLNGEEWAGFREETDIAVVVDAAASFDTVRAAALPAVVSLHATKLLAAGEGGFVVTTDGTFIEEIQKRANFGFWYSREATVRSCNAKMSEYNAAVGLASLDRWQSIRADFLRIAGMYRAALSDVPEIKMQNGFGDSWTTSTMVVETLVSNAETLSQALAASGIGSRRWWGGGLHRHRLFQSCERASTKYSEVLADRVIGIPCWRDLSDDQIRRICEVIQSISR